MIKTYKLGKTIGHGSFGQVKLALNKKGREVAIKIITRPQKNTIVSLKKEIQIMKLLKHKNIIQLIEVIDIPTDVFLVIEYANNGDLYNYVVTNTLSEQEALFLFRQIVNAVLYCHKNGIVHRDLKLENILLDQHSNHHQNSNHQLNIKICDFGLAHAINQDGEFLKTSCGSPNYAAPELLVTDCMYVGTEIDVWSLGVILYAMCCGSLPFDEKNIKNLFDKIKSGIYKEPLSISNETKDIISRMLCVDPIKRISLRDIFAPKRRIQKIQKVQISSKKWYLGIQSKKDPMQIMAEIFRSLKKLKCKWKIENPYRLFCCQDIHNFSIITSFIQNSKKYLFTRFSTN